jgi:predicted kinase
VINSSRAFGRVETVTKMAVLVNGVPGSGKTTLAIALARALELPLFSKDSVKETLADMLAAPPATVCTPQQWSQKLGAAAGETLWTLLTDTHRGAVLESPWLSHLRPVVIAGLNRAAVDRVHEIWCDVPLAVARRRYEERASLRHAIHRDQHVDDDQWRDWGDRAQPLAIGHVSRVDTSKPVDIAELVTQLASRPDTTS